LVEVNAKGREKIVAFSSLSLRSKPLKISPYGESLLLLQAARRASRPRRSITDSAFYRCSPNRQKALLRLSSCCAGCTPFPRRSAKPEQLLFFVITILGSVGLRCARH